MLDSMLGGEEPQVISTGDITSPENHEVISTVNTRKGNKKMKLTKNDIKQKRAELVEVLLEIGGLTSQRVGTDPKPKMRRRRHEAMMPPPTTSSPR